MYLETEDFWRRWLEQSTYRGRWRAEVERSAIALKLMTYAPSGGLVAAPTAGLPEQVGGFRNWDYRYTWVRDGSFSVAALLGLGFTEEAAAFGDWLRKRVEEQAGDQAGPLKIMYRVDGSSDLVEETLDHLDGYMGSRPVRIGNGAADQLQLDIYGEAMNSIHGARQRRARRLGRRPRGLDAHRLDDRLALRALAGPRRGHLGDAGRPSLVRLRAAHVVGRVRPRDPHGDEPGPPRRRRSLVARARRHPRADHDQGLERAPRRVRPVRGRRRARRVARAHAARGVHRAERPAVAVDDARDGQDARRRQPRLPLRPRGVTRRSPGFGGDVLAVHLPVRRRARPLGPPRRRPADVHEDADLRQPPRPLLRGDRRRRPAGRQLPAGVHPPRADRRRRPPRPTARSRAGVVGRPCERSAVAETDGAHGPRPAAGCSSPSRWPSSSAASPART